MFSMGMKVALWRVRFETFQVLVDSQHTLTVTEVSDEAHCKGVIEDGSFYKSENGSWWAESPEGVLRLDMAIHVWNRIMSRAEGPMRVLALPKGIDLVPGGDVIKCEKHNRYHLVGDYCTFCHLKTKKEK